MATTPENDTVLTVTELAARWRVARMTIHRLAEAKKIKSFAIDPTNQRSHRRFWLSDVVAYEHSDALPEVLRNEEQPED